MLVLYIILYNYNYNYIYNIIIYVLMALAGNGSDKVEIKPAMPMMDQRSIYYPWMDPGEGGRAAISEP